MTPVTPRIRFAEPADADVLAEMIGDLARSEGKTTPTASARELRDWLNTAPPPFRVLLAESDGAALGYLAFYRAFSLFKPGPVMLVENIYVRAEARGRGVGRALLARAAAEARARGWTRLELNVSHDNTDARAAYAALGFRGPGEAVQRLEDADLEALARRDD